MEWSNGFSDATTPGVAVTGSSAVMDFIEPKCGSDGVIGSTSRYCVTIGSGTTVHLYRPQSSSTSRYLVEDNNIGQSVILKFAGATIPDYSGEPLPMPVRSPLIPVDPKPNISVSRQFGCSKSECDSARGAFTRSSGSIQKVDRRMSSGSITVTAGNNVGCIDAKATASGAEPGRRVLVSAIAPQTNTQWSAFIGETGVVDIRVCTIAPITGIPVTYRWSVLPSMFEAIDNY
jgi:hypothetical protein